MKPSMPARVTILGVPVDRVTVAEAESILRALAESGIGHHVMTPNPEMIVAAQKRSDFLHVLQKTSLNVADGAGLLFAARLLGSSLPERVTGTDLVERIAAMREMQPVFFLGAGEGIAEKAAAALASRHPELVVAGTFSGSPRPEDADAIIAKITASNARTLLVAYGAPEQDLWIDRVLTRLPSVRVAMGIGGAFDFLAGVRSRAPLWMRRIGIEWLWRLLQEPSRFGRILTAVIVFPFLVLTRRPPSLRGGTRTA